MDVISQRELRNDSGRVLRQVEAGASFDITVAGRVVARLSPAQSPRRRFVDPATVRAIADDTPVDGASWAADVARAFDDQMDDDPWARGG